MKIKIYVDTSEWWVGYRRGPAYHYVCILPTLVVNWRRRRAPITVWMGTEWQRHDNETTVPAANDLVLTEAHIYRGDDVTPFANLKPLDENLDGSAP